MAVYRYRPLDLEVHSIRLLKLLEGHFEDGIQCELIDGWIEESIPYDALSYTWGSTAKAATITVDRSMMGVTLNVYEALQQIRSKHESRYLWIDAICIDQDNLQERGHQVQQMSLIYQKAERVVIWLGQGTKETDLLMDSMKQVHNIFVEKEGDWRQLARFRMRASLAGCYEGMDLILSRPWFRRIWIIQEIANARAATVLCGKKSVSASTFAQVPGLLGLQPDPQCQAVLDIMPGVSRQTSWWKDKRDLYTLLRKFRKSEATDERDIVYALLGISSDTCICKALLPDYEKPLFQVIQDSTSFLLTHMNLDDSFYGYLDWTFPEFVHNLESLSSAVLRSASEYGRKEIVELLLITDGIEVELKDRFGQTPLSLAAQNGHKAVIKLLLESGEVNVNSEDNEYITPLSWAAKNGNEAVVKLLLENSKVDVNSKDKDNRTPLSWAVKNENEAVVKLLLENSKVDVNSKDKNGRTPLLWAIKTRNEAVVKLLLENSKVDVNLKDKDSWTPLSWAAQNWNEAVVKLLLENSKVDVNLKDKNGRTPLSWAIKTRNEAVVKLLLENSKVDVNLKDEYGKTPLLWAAQNWNVAVVKLLLESGKADVNLKDKDGWTPLLYAIRSGNKAVVKLLLKTDNIDVNSGDNYGQTLLEWATENGYQDVIELLHKHVN